MNERTDLLIGEANRQKISISLFVLSGLGGVGGTALEVLARFGAEHLFLIDGDTFEESNLNRQILSTKDSIGSLKTETAKKRILSINQNADVGIFSKRVNENNISELIENVSAFKKTTESKCNHNLKVFYIDAIDDVRGKCLLYKAFLDNFDATIISSMGAGRNFYSPLEITTLPLTHTCPLAKAVRIEAKKHLTVDKMNKITAIFGTEKTVAKPQDGILPSSITQTFNMGLMLARTTIEKALE